MNIPPTFITYCTEALGTTGQTVLDALGTQSPTSIRYNPRKLTTIADDAVPWCTYGAYLPERPSFTLDPLFHAGGYYVQEASSMFIWHVLQQITGSNKALKILDLCAAPGGKSTLLASLLDGNGLLHSNEIIRSRSQILVENLTKWGYSNIVVTNSDSSAFKKSNVQYDIILVDAPCSGEGLWRKDHKAIDEWSEKNVHMCAERQREIIDNILDSLAPNGHLIYSTCTFNNFENIDNCAHFTDTYNLQPIAIEHAEEWKLIVQEKNGAIGYQFVPTIQRGEGFFCAVFQKEDGKKQSLKRNKKPLLTNVKEDLSDWVNTNDAYILKKNKYDNIYLQPKPYINELEEILSCMNVLTAGTLCGQLSKKGLIPEHGLALAHLASNQIESEGVDKATALNYLRKEPIALTSTQKGWMTVKYDGLTLGFVKHLGNRINNYYPTNWRIRKK